MNLRAALLRALRGRRRIHVLCLAATFVSTTYVGGWHYLGFLAAFGHLPPAISLGQFWLGGLWFSLSVLAILGAHEWGHYAACRWYGVDASLPYFLPAPLPLTGTFGAFIRIRAPIPHRRALFDIGASGPFAGFAVAVPVLAMGLHLSQVVPMPTDPDIYSLGEPLLYRATQQVLWGALPAGQAINLHPMALAAWFGLLATALNLFPMAQLDGGHIAYAVFGRQARWITVATAAVAIGLSFVSLSWVVWTVVMVVVLSVTGVEHPATLDDSESLGRSRIVLAVAAAVVFALCFTPAPVDSSEPVVSPVPPVSASR